MKLLLFISLFVLKIAQSQLPNTCDSPIYCYGSLLHNVQMAEIYNDSKHFVDMHMKIDPSIILTEWEELLKTSNNKPNKNKLIQFVNKHFEEGQELENWNPSDYIENPKFLGKIQDDAIRKFAKRVVAIWKKLARKIRPAVLENSSRYSIIPLPNGFIVPGGRFRETYYWDTYWIITGLLLSEMNKTVRGMLDNFIAFIKLNVFIPNGGRVYYLKRSQPPLFTPMVTQYIQKTDDLNWLRKNIKFMEKELQYWVDNRFVKIEHGGTYLLARYAPESAGPRPESYREDYDMANRFSKNERDIKYNDIKGGAESGWDFSSQWFYDNRGGFTGNFSTIATRRSIPVDLNSFLYLAFKDLGKLYKLLDQSAKSLQWTHRAEILKVAINKVFWNESDGIWYDYDYNLKTHRRAFFPSHLAPLWVHAFDKDDPLIAKKILKYLTKEKVLTYLGGIPSSLNHNGEQWDYPNAWAPMQAIIVEGLENLGSKESKEQAKALAKKWVQSTYIGFLKTNELFEKYDVNLPGEYGGGGEYVVQSGFGWTNGVILDFIHKYY